MTTSDQTSFLYEVATGKPIPSEKLAYFQARLRFNLYDFVVTKFKEMEEKDGLTKAELARRIGCKPEQITRRLGAPGNWTLDTISDLLIGIGAEELEPASRSVITGPKRNSDGTTWRRVEAEQPKKIEKRKSEVSSALLQNRKGSLIPAMNAGGSNVKDWNPSSAKKTQGLTGAHP